MHIVLLRREVKYSQSMELMELSGRKEETYFSVFTFVGLYQHRKNPPKCVGTTMGKLTCSEPGGINKLLGPQAQLNVGICTMSTQYQIK